MTGFFDNEKMNPFIGGGALAVQIDDFNGDNVDHSNVDFIGGASAFPNNGGYNPTVTVGALAIRAAQAIYQIYTKNPAPLVEA